jgi:DNA-binding GntR family transcriptional regulator
MNIKQDIFGAKYKPNELITEKQISEKYGISKVTASAALHRLCAEGHLTNYPRSGYMVTMLSAREMQNLSRLRLAVESLVLDIICDEANDADIKSLYDNIVDKFTDEASASAINFGFHMSLARLTDDKIVINLVENLLGCISRIEQPISPEKHKLWQNYHRTIVDALLARDFNTAKDYLVKDLNQR